VHPTKYYSPEQIRKDKVGSACGTCGVEKKCLCGFGSVTWNKRALGKPRHRRGHKMKVDLEDIGLEVMDQVHLA